MIRNMLVGAVALFVGSASVGAYAAAKDDVQAAAKKLADAPSYAWTSTVEGGFGGNTEGKTQKDGVTMLSLTMRDNTVQAFIKGDRGAVKTEDGWKSSAELAQADQGPGRFLGRMVTNFRSPAAQAEEIAGKATDIAKADDAYTGTLSEEAAKSLMAFGGRRGGAGGGAQGGPQIKNAKGDVKFWTKDGVLSKMVIHVQGAMTINDEDRDINRTTTVEIKDVGSTKVEVPAEAKAKLE